MVATIILATSGDVSATMDESKFLATIASAKSSGAKRFLRSYNMDDLDDEERMNINPEMIRKFSTGKLDELVEGAKRNNINPSDTVK